MTAAEVVPMPMRDLTCAACRKKALAAGVLPNFLCMPAGWMIAFAVTNEDDGFAAMLITVCSAACAEAWQRRELAKSHASLQ